MSTAITYDGIIANVRSEAKDRLQKRRIEAIWEQMRADKLDALVIGGRGLLTQYGFLEYVAGFCPQVRLCYAVVTPDEQPVLITPTRSDAWYARQATDLADVRVAGQGDVISDSDGLPPVIAQVLQERKAGAGTIGMVGLQHIIPAMDYAQLRQRLPHASFTDGTPTIGRVKAVKSAEEQQEVLRSCAIADAGLEVFMERARQGSTGWELWGDVQRAVRSRGARDVLIMISSDPFFNDTPRNEPIAEGDLVCTYVEISGPNGYWVEKASLFAAGTISDAKRRIATTCLEAHAAASDAMRVGNTASDVALALTGAVRDEPVEFGIWHGHGVGVDHDVPVLSSEDSTPLVEGMALALHPNFVSSDGAVGASVADTYIVQADGPAVRGSQHDQKLFTI
jgi:Xaa-Pro aminopeptidase